MENFLTNPLTFVPLPLPILGYIIKTAKFPFAVIVNLRLADISFHKLHPDDDNSQNTLEMISPPAPPSPPAPNHRQHFTWESYNLGQNIRT